MRRPTAPAARLKKTALAEALQIGLVEEIQNLLGAEAIEASISKHWKQRCAIGP